MKKRIATKKSSKKQDFVYELRDTVSYLGGLYKEYRDRPAIITRRSTENGHCKWYVIEFLDGFTMEVKESWITHFPIIKEDTIDER